MGPLSTLYFVKSNAVISLKPSYFCKEIVFMATSSNQEVLMNFRISVEDHARLKSFAGSKKLSMSDLIRSTLLEKMNRENGIEEDLLLKLDRIKAVVDRTAIFCDAALIAACRYHLSDSEDLAGLNRRRSEALVGAKNRLTQNT